MALSFRRRSATPAPSPSAPAWLVHARDEWNDRNHNLARSRDLWAAVALFALVLNALAFAGIFYLAGTSRIVPYVVEVDRLGDAVAFAPATVLRNPDERIWREQLAKWLSNLRSVYLDPSHERYALSVAHAYLLGDAVAFTQRHLAENNPFTRAAQESVSVDITSILRLKEARSDARTDAWEITWVESRRSRFGARPASDEHWKAYIKTTIVPPSRSDRLLQNPLGLFVTYISWSRLSLPTPTTP